MGKSSINWQYFPKHSSSPEFLRRVVECFEKSENQIVSANNVGQTSNEVLAKISKDLQAIGFQVETGKTADAKVKIPVLFGPNGKIEKSFEADGYDAKNKVVIEVEAGRGVTNHQFLKDLFQACVMQDVDYLVIAVRNDYRGSDDFSKVATFLETLFASQRLKLPLNGVLIIGY
jgi:hypothetical protein